MKSSLNQFIVRVKIALIVSVISSSSGSLYAQKFGIKIYQNTDLFSTHLSSGGVNSTDWNVNFNRISFAVDMNVRNNFMHELEVFIPEHSKKLEHVQFPYGYHLSGPLSAANRESNFALRYEVNRKITKGKGPFSARLGVAINPYFLHIQYTPTSEAAYPTSLKNYGASVNIVPGFAYALSNKFQLSLNFPLKIYDVTYKIKNISNPAIPIRRQETRGYDNTFFENVFTMRFGFAYTFGK